VRARPAGAKEDVFTFLPFSLEKIAKKPPEEKADELEEPLADEDAVPGETGAEDDGEEPTAEKKPVLSPIDELLAACKDDEWQLKSMARNIVRAKNEVAWSDKTRFDKAVAAEKAKLKKRFDRRELDPILLKRLDVRVVGILSACSVKTPKPRPDGSVGAKWAILTVDDGNGQADLFAYAKAWEKCSALETKIDQLVMVCGEIAHRTVYAKEDEHKLNPQVGDVSFSVKEAYPLEEAMPLVSKELRMKLRYDDPALEEKMRRLAAAAAKNPGTLPTAVSLAMPDGTVVGIDLGPLARVAVTIGFLSELSKIVPQAETMFRPEDKTTLAAPERKPWEG
jgi:hypothetical protein